jgi:DNA-binding beta-propeller fold protein YncE
MNFGPGSSFRAEFRTRSLAPCHSLCLMLVCGLALSGCSSGGGNATSGSGGVASNPTPSIAALSPSSVDSGSSAFTLTVTGSQFVASSTINWNGQTRTTTYVSSTNLTASVNASDVASAGSAKVTVTNPAPGGGTSSSLPLTISKALPALSTRTDWMYIGAKVDAGLENFSYPPYLAYDAIRNQVFLSVPGSNVVKVFDTQTHAQKAEISIPSPYGIDISADGASVYVGTGTQFLYVLDPAALHVKQVLNSADAISGGFTSVYVFALNDGNLFILPEDGVDGGGTPLIWSLASGSASTVNAPANGAITRSGDRSSIAIASPYTSGVIVVYSVATKSFVTTPYPPADIVERVAANPAKDQFAVSDLDGNVYIYNSSLTLLGQIRIEPANQIGGQRLNGMVFSGDGSLLHLFVDATIQEYETASFTQQAVMAEPYSLGYFAEPLPLAEDSSGLIFAINEEGMNFIDVSKIRSTGLASVGEFYSYMMNYLTPDSGPGSGGTGVSSSVAIPSSSNTTLNAAYLGSTPMSNFSASSQQYSFITPSIPTTGAQNLLVMTSDATPLLAPKAFSFGPDVVRLVSTASGADGGGTGFLTGYGLGSSPSDLQIKIGGRSAAVTEISSRLSGLDEPFATPIESASFTVPAGATGLADVTLTTSAGSKTLTSAFQFDPATKLHATSASLEAGVYDPTRKAIYYTSTNQILTWSVTNDVWLSPISVPNSNSAALTGISISPNGQFVAVADQGNQAVVVFSTDTPQNIKGFPVSDGGFGLKPASVAISNQGKVYFNLAFTYRGGWGTRCQGDLMWMLDATSGVATDLAPFGQNTSFCMSIADRVLLSTDGNTVFVDDEGGLALYDVPTGSWSTLIGSEVANSDLAISGDNSRLVGTFALIDWSRGYLGTPAWSDLDLSDTQTLVMGEKMDRNGTVLFQPWTQALDIVDLSHLVKQQRIALPYPAQNVFDALVWDDDNDTAYMIVSDGLLEIPVALPLLLQSATPSSGSAGTSVILKGSGFASGDTATIDGIAVQLIVNDEHTATLTTPTHANGADVIKVTAFNGQSSSLDPGFVYGGTSEPAGQAIRNVRRFTRTPSVTKPHTISPAASSRPGVVMNP